MSTAAVSHWSPAEGNIPGWQYTGPVSTKFRESFHNIRRRLLPALSTQSRSYCSAPNHRHISSSSPKLTRQKIKIRYFQIFNCRQYFSFEQNVNTLLLDVGVVENNRLKCSMSDIFCRTAPLVSRVTCAVSRWPEICRRYKWLLVVADGGRCNM